LGPKVLLDPGFPFPYGGADGPPDPTTTVYGPGFKVSGATITPPAPPPDCPPSPGFPVEPEPPPPINNILAGYGPPVTTNGLGPVEVKS
jgi:hypothetical protein